MSIYLNDVLSYSKRLKTKLNPYVILAGS